METVGTTSMVTVGVAYVVSSATIATAFRVTVTTSDQALIVEVLSPKLRVTNNIILN